MFLNNLMPLLKKIMGIPAGIVYEKGILSRSVYNEIERLSLFPACLENTKKGLIVKPVCYSGSADIWAISKADALFMLDKNQKLSRGASVSFVRLT